MRVDSGVESDIVPSQVFMTSVRRMVLAGASQPVHRSRCIAAGGSLVAGAWQQVHGGVRFMMVSGS